VATVREMSIAASSGGFQKLLNEDIPAAFETAIPLFTECITWAIS
jgi:hypothetical protein